MYPEELDKKIEENQEILKNLDKRIHRIEKRFTWNTIFGFIKAIVIAGPIIIAIIYLTPVVGDYVKIFEPVVDFIKSNKEDVLQGETSDQKAAQSILESFCDPESREAMVEQFCQ